MGRGGFPVRARPIRAALALALPAAHAATPAPSIVSVQLPAPGEERRPIAVPSGPDHTLEVDLPAPLAEWAGRGFTPDPERFSGDFVIEASRGKRRLFVTPVAADAHRVLHVIVAPAEREERSIALEFLPAPAGLEWDTLVLEDGAPPAAPAPVVALAEEPPAPALRASGPDSELGLIRTLRLLLAAGAGRARAVAAANPALSFAFAEGDSIDFGDFSLAVRLAVRDATTGALGVAVRVANKTQRRLRFAPRSWSVRSGPRVYAVDTCDFFPALEPGSSGLAFLVVAATAGGGDTRLLPGSELLPSVEETGSENTRPVRRLGLADLRSP